VPNDLDDRGVASAAIDLDGDAALTYPATVFLCEEPSCHGDTKVSIDTIVQWTTIPRAVGIREDGAPVCAVRAERQHR